MRCALLLATLLAGCRADPCAAFAAQTCLELEVRWAAGGRLVDQLAVLALEGFALDGRTPPVAKDAFELPAVVPIGLGQFQGGFRLTVRALRSDGEIGSGELSAEIPRRAHRRYRVELRGAEPGDLGGDDAGARRPASFLFQNTPSRAQENVAFTTRVVALDGDGAPLADYAGSPAFTTDWGRLRVVRAGSFTDGAAEVVVALNRETVTAPAHLRASDGAANGESPPISVVPPAWTVIDASPIVSPGPVGWDRGYIRAPAWTRKNGVYYLYYYGAGGGNDGWGVATSTTGAAWIKPVIPSVVAFPGGWETGEPVSGFRPIFDGTRFIAAYSVIFRGVGFATSDDGYAWTRNATAVATAPSSTCTDTPFSRALVLEAGLLRLFLDGRDGPCALTSADGGNGWSAVQPTSGFASGSMPFMLDVRLDDGVYRMWYETPGSVPATSYATSSDGVSWVLSPSANLSFEISSVLWNEDLARFEAVFQEGAGLFRATRP